MPVVESGCVVGPVGVPVAVAVGVDGGCVVEAHGGCVVGPVGVPVAVAVGVDGGLSLIHISEPTRPY